MKATMMLCDFAQVTPDGKLTIVGGGIDWIKEGPSLFGLAIRIEVPWSAANQRHKMVVDLVDADGHPFIDPNGNPVTFEREFEVGRPPGVSAGTALGVPVANMFAGLPIPAGRYTFRMTIDGAANDDWQVTFGTPPSPLRQAG